MRFEVSTYISGDTIVHRADARVKLVLLLVYSISLFFISSWLGLCLYMVACLTVCVVARLPVKRLLRMLLPLYFILVFTLFFNSFSFDVAKVGEMYGMGDVSAGMLQYFEPIALIGSFGFVPAGFARGCFYVLRIIFLVFASLVVTFTTTSNELVDALNDFLRPLKKLRVPTDDLATIISIALRFIPITAEEIERIHAAQQSRGAAFGEGNIFRRIKAWQPVLIPLFVGLFRRASNLAVAMEARCYGMSPERTRLHPRSFSFTSASILLVGVGFCIACGIFL